MKQIIIALNFVCLVILSGCTLEASFEPEGYRSKLSVSATGNNIDGSISTGGYLTIQIVGEDDDGISQIRLRIPSINVDQEFTSHATNEHWEINQTFDITSIDFDAPRVIYVTLVDNDGSEYSRTISLKVDE